MKDKIEQFIKELEAENAKILIRINNDNYANKKLYNYNDDIITYNTKHRVILRLKKITED